MTEQPLFSRIKISFLNREGTTDVVTVEIDGHIQQVKLIELPNQPFNDGLSYVAWRKKK